MHPLPSPVPPLPWQDRRSAIHLDPADAANTASDSPTHRLLASHISALLPPGHTAPGDKWCAAVLTSGGAHRCCLTPHDGLCYAVQVVLLDSPTKGRLALITVRDAAEALRDPHWRAAERMEVVISTAGALTHKTNNTLTTLLANAEHLADMPELPAAALNSAHQIMRAVEKLEQTTRRINLLSAAVRPQGGQCDPTEQLSRLAERMRPMLPPGLTLNVAASQGLGLLLVDPRGFDQVIEELVANSVQALGTGGQVNLTITREAGCAWPGFVWLAISVTDDGPGIPDGVLSGLDEALLGRMGRGSRLSLGLSIVRAFAQGLGGRFTAERPTQCGTRMTLTLPALVQPAAISQPSSLAIVTAS